ncbi:DNA repair protein RecN [Mongoliitalea daihaiensis]|uniref:DNA repair protein RecN n=1 Tax=Mongoliitalea daihaiensis TaxID=2782006 RepID=UPI001F017F9B|nr:DNA repair protein RecN [Mongoliitalea daihaiensis]UJP65485.1 DNA repair protein RecN [Mongoliitalea daihaiensis]
MLKSLRIQNYALIQSLEMNPSKSLNMITGETGAGKSIMLGAVGLLLGNRADSKTLHDPENKCVVEGVFELSTYQLQHFFEQHDLDYEPECIIRREISPAGKSRAFVNDTPVVLDILKDLGKSLMDVHSQHDTLMLGDGSYQLSLIDAYASTQKELEYYQETFASFEQSKKRLRTLQKEAADLQKEADFNKFQLDELATLRLEAGEQAMLEEEQEILENAEEIKSKIQEVLNQLEDEQFGILRMLSQTSHGVQHLSKLTHKFDSLQERTQSAWIELQDIAASLEEEDQKIEVDFERLEEVRERLSKIYQLQKKHGLDSVEALILLEESLAEKVLKAENLDEDLEKLEKELQLQEKNMLEAGKKLTKKRTESFLPFAQELTKLLQQLGMENADIQLEQTSIAPTKLGLDQLDILFSANKGVKPQALKQVASGGEFSRLIFAIKYIMADKMALPTLIFDEIDTGVSGEVALKMVKMMQNIADKHQVICISHLPQVAAKGDHHYFVYKDHSAEKTISRMKLLEKDARVEAIAQMIAGASPSEAAFESARELLKN